MKRRFHFIIFLVFLLVCSIGVFFLIKYHTTPVAITRPETNVSEINFTEFSQQTSFYHVEDRCELYLGLSVQELSKYRFLRIHRTEICETSKIPISFGAFLIQNKHNGVVEKVIPFMDNSDFTAGIYRFRFTRMASYCNIENGEILYIRASAIIRKYVNGILIEKYPEGDEPGVLYYHFRWKASSGMPFDKNAVKP